MIFMQKTLKILISGFTAMLITKTAYGNPEADMAGEVAESLAEELADRLKDEDSRVIFLNLQSCAPSLSDDEHWCNLFLSRVQSVFSKEKIKFLGESQSDEIRKKIVMEQVYQHGSKHVNISKAVELGVQDAFHAFVSITVDGSSHTGTVHVSAQSVKIEAAAISISINRTVTTQVQSSASFKRVFAGLMIVGVGAVGLNRGFELEEHFRGKADSAYVQYKASQNEEDALRYRREVETNDEKASTIKEVQFLGWFTVLVGSFYMFSEGEPELTYDIAGRDTENQKNQDSDWTVQPMVAADSVWLGFGFEW